MSTAAVSIPGNFSAIVRKDDLTGECTVTGWLFIPSASSAGYRGPSAFNDGPATDIDVESVDGPFWKAVQTTLAETPTIPVRWEE